MFNSLDKLLILISTLESVTYKQSQIIIDILKDYDKINFLDNTVKEKLQKSLSHQTYEKLINAINTFDMENYLKNLKEQQISIVTIFDSIYPALLKEIDSPPLVLYAKGNLDLLNTQCLAVVGTRRASKYGREITKKFVDSIALSGVTIVSGLADGIDSVAHSTALDVNGKTIAVLGSGFNNVYPATNKELFNKICEKGLALSEFKPSEKPLSYNFPLRNRIVAGLSKAVLITEAPIKSGAMITKNIAVDANREIFAIPARLNDFYSSGCNEIIKSCQSAMVLDPKEIIEFYGLNSFEEKVQALTLNLEEQIIINVLATDEVAYQELVIKTNFPTKKLNPLLLGMEMKGLIVKLPGNIYRV